MYSASETESLFGKTLWSLFCFGSLFLLFFFWGGGGVTGDYSPFGWKALTTHLMPVDFTSIDKPTDEKQSGHTHTHTHTHTQFTHTHTHTHTRPRW